MGQGYKHFSLQDRIEIAREAEIEGLNLNLHGQVVP